MKAYIYQVPGTLIQANPIRKSKYPLILLGFTVHIYQCSLKIELFPISFPFCSVLGTTQKTPNNKTNI